ncbi:MAG: hypothetical protein K9J30_07290 [Bacteroidales bacterium]|nr:hypothetical protein [Bacteroidales bacterium]
MDPFTSRKFSRAIIRRPCREMIHGITSAGLGIPDYHLALQQHKEYERALRSLGLEVFVLESDYRYPDSAFVEDVALCTPGMAVITAPGAASRKGEELLMERELGKFYEHIERVEEPGTLDAGDVMMAGNHYYIGISGRTNHEGAAQLIRILERYGMSGEKVEIGPMLHLKTGVSYLENETVVAAEMMSRHPSLSGFRKIIVPEGEEYAANSVWINGAVLLPDGFPKTAEKVQAAGYPVIPLPVSEYQKLDGGLSCMSLRF